MHQATLDSPYRSRWIRHLLGRLSYDRFELGEVEKYSGVLTATILQTFTRTHGADKPKATKAGDAWTVESSVDLPLHIANGQELTRSTQDWVDLMQSCGYSVPVPKPAAAPILNFKAHSIVFRGRGYRNEPETFKQIAMTKAEYRDVYKDKRGVMVSACGQFRVKVYFDHWSKPTVSIFITDSKIHPVPDSESVIHDQTAVVA
jgi:alpha-L-arabinofuranosidase